MNKDNYINAITVCVVGVGGTGSSFAELFTRYIGDKGQSLNISSLMLIDGDFVEEKNLKNQAYMKEDVGFCKAAVMADALNSFLPSHCVHWMGYNTYLQDAKQLINLLTTSQYNEHRLFILIGCSDNHNCRLIMENVFNHDSLENVFLYDSANEYKNGECVFAHKLHNRVFSPPRSVIFPDVKKGDLRNVTELSCAELNSVDPQHIIINRLAALQLMMGLISFFEDGVPRYGFSIFDASMSTQFFPYTKEEKEVV